MSVKNAFWKILQNMYKLHVQYVESVKLYDIVKSLIYIIIHIDTS